MIRKTITTIKLTASEGMVLTNGTTYGRVIYLPDEQMVNTFFEITEEEYNNVLEEKRRKEAEMRGDLQ